MAEETDNCYICLAPGSEEDPFADPLPCACTGTIKLHNSCLEELIRNTTKCGICKQLWSSIGTVRRTYWPSGRLQSEGTYVNDKLNGTFKTYFNNGQLWKEYNCDNGILDGPMKEYFSNGQLMYEVRYIYGMKQGIERAYFEDGRLNAVFNWTQGTWANRQYKRYRYNDETGETFVETVTM